MTGPRIAVDETAQVLGERIRLLYGAVVAVPLNLVNAAIMAGVLWRAYPHAALLAWLGATVVVMVGRLAVWQQYRRAPADGRDPKVWARRHVAGTMAAGLLWGAVTLGMPAFCTPRDYLFVTFVIVGLSAAAVSSLASYLPALFAYVVPSLVMLSAACLASPEPDFLVIGLLVLLYAAVIIIVGLNANERILRAAQLQIENATLNLSLRAAAAEVEAAKQDKWSTLAHLSHELRTPLNAILGFSEAMHRELFGTLGNEKYRDYAKHVHSGGEHLLKLANEILDLSSGENGTLAPMESCIDVTALVRDCVDLMTSAAEAAHVRLLYASGPDLPTLFGDETKLRRLLGHLLGNAVKFTPPGGAVAIDASRHADGGIVLAVRDTGIGMNQADVPRAMLPFVRLSSALTHATAGAGLGLPICKRLAELHGADFTVTSQRGVGTLCTVRFPASRSRLPVAAVQAA